MVSEFNCRPYSQIVASFLLQYVNMIRSLHSQLNFHITEVGGENTFLEHMLCQKHHPGGKRDG